MIANAVLSRQEKRVAERKAWGATQQEIADALFVHRKTIDNHTQSIYRKTGCRTSGEFSAWWFCTNFNISFDLSPRKVKTIAFVLFLILIPGEIITSNIMIRTRTVKVARVTFRTRRNDETDYQYLS